jgi:hypothetical protein
MIFLVIQSKAAPAIYCLSSDKGPTDLYKPHKQTMKMSMLANLPPALNNTTNNSEFCPYSVVLICMCFSV